MATRNKVSGCGSHSSSLLLKHAGLLAVIGICVALGCSSETTKRRHATCTYWSELSRLCYQAEALSHSLGKPTTPAAAAEVLASTSASLKDLSDGIAQLPTTFVDSEAVALGADYAQMLHAAALLFSDMRDFLKQNVLLADTAQSPSMYVESFMRGALGDPLGTSNEFKAAGQKLSARGDQLQARFDNMEQQVGLLNAREVKLRVMLAEKYHSEFPPLSPPRKRKS